MIARRRLTFFGWVWYIIVPGIFVAGCIAVLLTGEDIPMAVFGILFFGGGAAVVLLIKRRDARPLIIDEHGMRNGRKTIELRWDQIDGVYVRDGWLAIDSPVPGRAVLGVLGKTNAAMIGVPENAAHHLIQWDAGIEPDLGVIGAAIQAYGVPVDDLS